MVRVGGWVVGGGDLSEYGVTGGVQLTEASCVSPTGRDVKLEPHSDKNPPTSGPDYRNGILRNRPSEC